jgi:hypothetical protein
MLREQIFVFNGLDVFQSESTAAQENTFLQRAHFRSPPPSFNTASTSTRLANAGEHNMRVSKSE